MDTGLLDLASTSWNDFLSLAPASAAHSRDNGSLTLRFLDNFTKRTGLVESFDCGTYELRRMVLDQAQQKHGVWQNAIAPLQLDKSLTIDPLDVRCHEVVALVKEVAMFRPKNSAVDVTWSDVTHDMCSQFFAPANIRTYLELYWSIWHPNVNIVHRPTFEPIAAKSALLAAMAVIGACVSPNRIDKDDARVWFNAVEELVFTDDDFCSDESGLTDDPPNRSKIQAMQAAYIVCLYQNWEGSDSAKRRIRRHRFSTLVSVARDIELHNARHIQYTNRAEFDWSAFAAREELIRTCLWIFLLDTAFVIFNNLPPRMVIKEMAMDLASCEAVFQAESADVCFRTFQRKSQNFALQLPRVVGTFYRAAEILCKAELDDLSRQQLADLGPLNLFAITSSLHSMIFHYQNNFGSESQLVPIRNALENWKMVWTEYTHELALNPDHAPLGSAIITPSNMWKRIGFMRHASDYWLLASLILDRICITEHQPSDGEAELVSDSLASSNAAEQKLYPVLQKYDETSMQQVNDLIAHFQQTTIS